MYKFLAYSCAVFALAGCTHGNISSTPMEIPGVGTVYRYQGRANFAHQMAEADRLMAEECKARNGGKPVMVNLQQRDLGMMAIGSGQANTTFNATGTGNSVAGTARTTSTSTMSGLRNMNQEILFRCVVN